MLFDSDFEVFVANTEKSKDIHYQIRYQVYCQETGFEDPDMFTSGREVDEFDDDSIHFIVRSKKTKEWIGAIRVIVGKLDSLPINNLIPESAFHRRVVERELQRNKDARVLEISRLCIVDRYRKSVNGAILSSLKKHYPEIMLGLLRAAYSYCLRNKIDICFFTATKTLARVLRKLDMNFLEAGEECDYHGLRVPYFCNISTFLDHTRYKAPSVYAMFNQPVAYTFYSEIDKKRTYIKQPVPSLLIPQFV